MQINKKSQWHDTFQQQHGMSEGFGTMPSTFPGETISIQNSIPRNCQRYEGK